jgi:hypothetical protein
MRVANAVFWLYVWLSNVLTPAAPSHDFWAAKAMQLAQFGPFDDIPALLGRAVIPAILWAVIDWRIRSRAKPISAS